MGRYSYGIYVYHQVAAFPAVWLFGALLATTHVRSRAVSHIIHLGANLCITIPLAVLSFHFYERHFLKLKRYFSDAPSASELAPEEESEPALQS